MTLIIAYVVISAGIGALLEFASNPQADWQSMLLGAAFGPILLPQLILERIGIQIR